MNVKFINQAGLYIEDGGQSISIDPWFIPSTINNPQICAIATSNWGIDFQLRHSRDQLSSFSPNCVLVSKIHPRHSPLVEIYTLICQGTNTLLAAPCLPLDQENEIRKTFAKFSPQFELRFCEAGHEFKVGRMTVRALPLSDVGTLGWLVSSDSGSVLHIGDSGINRNMNQRALDALWSPLQDLRPLLMFISAGGRAVRAETNQEHKIIENAIMSPTEAARLTAFVNPSLAATFATFNQSIRERDLDYTLPFALVEDQFEWALDYLAPNIKTIKVKPGQNFVLNPHGTDDRPSIVVLPS